ncbi:MAG: triphosphoribosyl-dephospho-CoA synthase [Vulcanimicrobiaceae bacterium]
MSGVAHLARAATTALLDELTTTPKPGLVDLEHRGAHRDLCLDRLHASARSLEPFFAELAASARGHVPSVALREEIGDIGRRAERAMLRASGGPNTHRGALWALGLLVAAAAATGSRPEARAIASVVAELARMPDRFAGDRASHGRGVMRRFGVSGARGEARAGLPHVVNLALPLVRGGTPRADVLLALLERVDDTCVLHRSGARTLAHARRGARQALALGGTATVAGLRATRRLDAYLVAHDASPGGCADLLAAAFFLNAVAV